MGTWYTARVHPIRWLCSVLLTEDYSQVVPFCRTLQTPPVLIPSSPDFSRLGRTASPADLARQIGA